MLPSSMTRMAQAHRKGGPASGRRCQKCGARRGASVASMILVAASVATWGRAAEAGGALHLGVDWNELGTLLRPRDTPLLPPETWWLGPNSRIVLASPLSETPLLEPSHPSKHVALIAHDWSAARLLMGRLSPADHVRLDRSRRMVVMRGRLAGGPLAPVVDVALGQWRVDPDVPLLPHDVELAGQFGAGLELAFSSSAQMALEGNCTVLYPDPREARWIHRQDLWSSFVAVRFTF